MTFLKLGVGFWVTVDQVVLLQSYPSRPARRDKQAAEGAGLYKDATNGGKKRETLRTLVHLKCGMLVGSPIGADALANRPPVETAAKLSSRRNNLENAQIVGEDGAAPIERAARAPRGRSFANGEANPNALPTELAPVEPTSDAQPANAEAERNGLFGRLLGRTDAPR